MFGGIVGSFWVEKEEPSKCRTRMCRRLRLRALNIRYWTSDGRPVPRADTTSVVSGGARWVGLLVGRRGKPGYPIRRISNIEHGVIRRTTTVLIGGKVETGTPPAIIRMTVSHVLWGWCRTRGKRSVRRPTTRRHETRVELDKCLVWERGVRMHFDGLMVCNGTTE